MTEKTNWVWVKDDKEVWLPAEVTIPGADGSGSLPDTINIVQCKGPSSVRDDGKVEEEASNFKEVKVSTLPRLVQDSIHPAMFSSVHTTVNDLIKLEEFGEPAVLHALRHRYSKGLIYSSIGDILLAVNPFRVLPIYSMKVLEMYKVSEDVRRAALPPHIYSIASASYWHMLTESKDQAIIISGESGAGKTGDSIPFQ